MFVVDTNVLVYAADRSAEEFAACRRALDRWRAEPTPWYLTWGIVYEFLRITTHPRVFRTPWPVTDAWHFIATILATQGISVLVASERHQDVAAQVLESVPAMRGNLLFDARTAILMREHGITRIYTRDTDFHRFPFVEVLDPVTSD